MDYAKKYQNVYKEIKTQTIHTLFKSGQLYWFIPPSAKGGWPWARWFGAQAGRWHLRMSLWVPCPFSTPHTAIPRFLCPCYEYPHLVLCDPLDAAGWWVLNKVPSWWQCPCPIENLLLCLQHQLLLSMGLEHASVTQIPTFQLLMNGQNVTLKCIQNMTHNCMYWYRQDMGIRVEADLLLNWN